MTDNPSIIFYDNYWDNPLSGVCEYKGEMLYFLLKDSHDHVDKYSLPKDVQDRISKIESDFVNKMDRLFLEINEDTENIGSVDNYEILRFDKFLVQKKVSYDLYRVPSEIMNGFLKYYLEWSNRTSQVMKLDGETIESLECCVARKITREDIPSFEHIGVFLYEDFQSK